MKYKKNLTNVQFEILYKILIWFNTHLYKFKIKRYFENVNQNLDAILLIP